MFKWWWTKTSCIQINKRELRHTTLMMTHTHFHSFCVPLSLSFSLSPSLPHPIRHVFPCDLHKLLSSTLLIIFFIQPSVHTSLFLNFFFLVLLLLSCFCLMCFSLSYHFILIQYILFNKTSWQFFPTLYLLFYLNFFDLFHIFIKNNYGGRARIWYDVWINFLMFGGRGKTSEIKYAFSSVYEWKG